ncbi:molybdate ABC transporter substrate-binding protein [Alicycliphilus denitrificans]|uniref:Molybdenum ABC transporter, periplasmic molybdate-binding protein n=2 Tax=Alicycliphilus denitrificans TaxID=179636 RepID=F4GEW3_ALIDK|nr:molybdate ABC transporter substrate-binding protein [Alicycliphilus denitrificans]ADV00199.1 molybdenum ABC transporter, periplasmic molybdate-binding protein [Alicycliphilus denitrificans BC]AEB84999.1 molybdenum ABC transporter, periplasmic molybdate-binding protein [Alicycliphilus denitrificans K601]QKD44017.1 molybdate ABC transporter substrate-binding protein [Alicycliphilus denitrificans]GAO23095.1 molybdenum ABC transporter substrate-binding protein [Alicycliphilus sp. B1]
MQRFFLACAAFLLAANAWAADALLVAAGAGYRKPVMELLEDFSKSSGMRTEASFGNMRQVETQARQNPDIALMIGDRAFLEPMGLAERFQPLGTGRLVLVTARGQAIASLADLREPRFRRIALPDRAKAVYGNAAATCLARLGLAQPLAGRLVEVATVPQVSAYVATGEVDAGFLNRTEALALQGRAGAAIDAPQDCYDPIELSVGVLKGRAGGAAARAFLNYLASPAARQVLERHGM